MSTTAPYLLRIKQTNKKTSKITIHMHIAECDKFPCLPFMFRLLSREPKREDLIRSSRELTHISTMVALIIKRQERLNFGEKLVHHEPSNDIKP